MEIRYYKPESEQELLEYIISEKVVYYDLGVGRGRLRCEFNNEKLFLEHLINFIDSHNKDGSNGVISRSLTLDVCRIPMLSKQDFLDLNFECVDEEITKTSNWYRFKNKKIEIYVQLYFSYFPRTVTIKALGNNLHTGNCRLSIKNKVELSRVLKMLNAI